MFEMTINKRKTLDSNLKKMRLACQEFMVVFNI